jgi:uncharacterized membrane protein
LNINDYFTEEQQKKITAAIAEAERSTSGEVRVHLEKKCAGDDPVKRAEKIFHQLKMDATELHNGILFYLAFESHHFAVIGDKGIHEKVHQEFWNEIKDKTLAHFKKQEFTEGLVESILECGRQLKKYFPYKEGDKNELQDDLTFGDIK